MIKCFCFSRKFANWNNNNKLFHTGMKIYYSTAGIRSLRVFFLQICSIVLADYVGGWNHGCYVIVLDQKHHIELLCSFVFLTICIDVCKLCFFVSNKRVLNLFDDTT